MARAANPDLTAAVFTAEPGSKSEEALNLLASWTATLDETEGRASPTAETRGSDADRAHRPEGEHQVTPLELFFDPCCRTGHPLRDLRGMTEGFGPLPGSQNMAISSTFT
jgi:hypothetical protein